VLEHSFTAQPHLGAIIKEGESEMRKILSAIQISIMVILLMPILCLAEQKSPMLYTVALEREFADQPSNGWDPTLYCIDLQQKKVINKVKLSDSGTPILLVIQENLLKVVLGYGMAANGTQVGNNEYASILWIDPVTMQIKETTREEGVSEKYFEASDKRRGLSKLQKEKGIPEFGLEYSKEKNKIFTLNLKINPGHVAINIYDLATSKLSDSIVLQKDREDLGILPDTDGTKLIDQNTLVSLFRGKVILGHYFPGYIAIMDLTTKEVDYVEIGSDAARGIVVK
jgi:hypothetical protein